MNKKIDSVTASNFVQKFYKDGTEIEKGAVLTEDFLEENEEQLRKVIDYFTAYPDCFIDLITPSYSNFKLFFYQRIFLRAIMRFKDIYVTAPRAFSKSFISILGLFLQCVFIPGRKVFICAPNKKQSAQIAKEKLYEIYDKFPILKKEVMNGNLTDTPGVYGPDYVSLKFRNGSQFDVVGALESARGGRRHGFRKYFYHHF